MEPSEVRFRCLRPTSKNFDALILKNMVLALSILIVKACDNLDYIQRSVDNMSRTKFDVITRQIAKVYRGRIFEYLAGPRLGKIYAKKRAGTCIREGL